MRVLCTALIRYRLIHKIWFVKAQLALCDDAVHLWWEKYSGLLFCESGGNSGATGNLRRATGNRRNHHCGDDSILRANFTRDLGLPCLSVVGASVWGLALLVVDFSVSVSILFCSLRMSGAALSTRLMRALSLRGSCSWLWRAQWVMNGWLLVFLSRMCCHKASWTVLGPTTCGISGCSEGSPACYRQLVVIIFFLIFYPSTLSSGS